MKIAFIPPKGLYSWASWSTINMSLAHLIDDEEYRRSFLPTGDQGRRKLLIDNGAAEGSKVTNTQLLAAAKRVDANEIVVPDELGDAEVTRTLCERFFEYPEVKRVQSEYSWLGVAQGKTEEEIKKIIDFYSETHINAIGIPRLLIPLLRRSIRIDIANWIEATFPKRFEIHLLGTSGAWPLEVMRAAQYAPSIRSVDTSMPFNYAEQGVYLNQQTKEYIVRPRGYFGQDWSRRIKPDLLRLNVLAMLEWVRGN